MAVRAAEDQALTVEREDRVDDLETPEAHPLGYPLHAAVPVLEGQRQRVERRGLRTPRLRARQLRIQVEALGARGSVVVPDDLSVWGAQLCGDRRVFECALNVSGDGERTLSGCRVVVCTRREVLHMGRGQRHQGHRAEQAVEAPRVLVLQP